MADTQLGNAAQLIKDSGIKATSQRLALLETLLQSQQHFTAEQLYQKMQQQGESMGPTAIYRVLADLCSAGLIHRQHFSEGKAHYELAKGEPHFHLVNVKDGQIEEWVDEGLVKALKQKAQQMGYDVVDLQLNLHVSPLLAK
ncbi:Fur family transcriptional regulator [Gallaecimonas mangrovi]|uniref:Fur family transcriptional regulator n=1 Tax=Gallaecimonas mangrovi TaxID=2291597 RepID=UPI0018677FDB|nr:transcriptional repressor [Gallaecimonas mangrovi]